jgi:transmembrane sensor
MNEDDIMDPALSPSEQIDARAAAWFLERADGAADAESEAVFEAWLAQSPKHQLAYWRMEAGWDRAGLLAAVRPPRRVHRGADAKAPWSRWFVRAAAVVLIAAAGASAFVVSRRDDSVTYETPVGGHRTVTLADGSRIEMNTATTLKVASDEKGRHIELLQGEAFFHVKHDGAHPFVVDAGDHRLVDLGTEFSVRRNADELKVGLVEGSVRLESAGTWSHSQLAVLAPGDVAVATPGKVTIVKAAAQEVTDDLAWRKGRLVFRHATLADAAAEFARYNKQTLTIPDARVASLTFSSTFPTDGVEAFVRVAQISLGLHVERRGDEIVISR